MTTIAGTDPETGDPVYFALRKTKAGFSLQRLPPHLYDLSQMSPKRLEALADFTEMAYSAYGAQKTGALPPAAEAVAKLKRPTDPSQNRVSRARVQERYRAMLPPELRDRLVVLEDHEAQRELSRKRPRL